MSDSEKRATLTGKLQQNEYTLLKGSILPRTIENLSYEETKDWLEKLFGNKKSIHQRRFNFENVQIRDSETFRAFSTRVNRL